MNDDTRELQQDIAQTRTHLDQTLNAIEQRLAPRQLLDEGLDYLRHSGAREYVANLGQAAKNDPLPLALVGVGLAWLMMSNGRHGSDHQSDTSQAYTLGSAANGTSGTSGSLGDKAAGVRDKVSDLGHKLSEGTRDTAQRLSDTAAAARERAQRVGEAARHGGERVRGAYDYLVNEQPLALGAIGLAVGVLLAASAPRTRHEDELLGSASDRLKDDAMAAGREQLDKVKTAAASAKDAAVDEGPADPEPRASAGRDGDRAAPPDSPTPR
jgi:hypothetical protein